MKKRWNEPDSGDPISSNNLIIFGLKLCEKHLPNSVKFCNFACINHLKTIV